MNILLKYIVKIKRLYEPVNVAIAKFLKVLWLLAFCWWLMSWQIPPGHPREISPTEFAIIDGEVRAFNSRAKHERA